MSSQTKIRALIVDNNPTAANLLHLNLVRRDFEVECVHSLHQAITRTEFAARKSQPIIDVILLDLTLPDSSGLSTFHDLYRQAGDIPIVVMSGHSDQQLANEAITSGAQDFLVKGIPSFESVARCLRFAAERQRFEMELWQSERLTRLIIENAHDAFASVDASGNITGWNLQAENTFGHFRKDAIGKSFVDTIIPRDLRGLFNQQIEAFLEGKRGNLINNRVEMALLRKDGRLFPAEIAIFPVTIGSSHTFCTFIQDISERKLIERRLQTANKALEPLQTLQDYAQSLQSHCLQTGDQSSMHLAQSINRCVSQIHAALKPMSTKSDTATLSSLFPPAHSLDRTTAGPSTLPLPMDQISR